VEPALVQPLPFSEREQLDVVLVVGDDRQTRLDRPAVDRQTDCAGILGEEQEAAKLCERVPPAPVALAAVDELRVEPDGDVVQEEPLADPSDVDPPLRSAERIQRADRVVAVEPEVAREVVPRAEGDADEGEPALERDFGDRGERAVAAGDAQRISLRASGELGRIVFGAEDPGLDPAPPGLFLQLLDARASAARARIDDEQLGLDRLEAERALECRLRLRADRRRGRLAVPEEDDRRNRGDAVALREALLLVDVDLDELERTAALLGDLLERGLDEEARLAPLGPEVDEDRRVGREDLLIEGLLRDGLCFGHGFLSKRGGREANDRDG
jgi:hypothetical protein